MSVNLLIRFQDPQRKVELIPVANQAHFNALWKPAAIYLNLERIVMFGDIGIRVDQRNVDNVQHELETLKQYWLDGEEAGTSSIQHDVRRIDNVIAALQIIRDDPTAKGSIG